MRILLYVLALMIVLTACSQDPWKAEQIQAQAEADKVRVESEQFALNQEQNRRHAEEMQAIAMSNERLEYERRMVLEQTIREGLRIFWTVILLTGSAAVVFIIIMGTRTTIQAYQEAAQGITKAIVQVADLRSRLIYLDDKGQFPMLYEYVGRGKYMLTDPNTGATMELDTRNDGDGQKIAGAIAIRHTGVVARETRRSKSDTASSVPLSQKPPLIDATAFDIKTITKDLMRRADE